MTTLSVDVFKLINFLLATNIKKDNVGFFLLDISEVTGRRRRLSTNSKKDFYLITTLIGPFFSPT